MHLAIEEWGWFRVGYDAMNLLRDEVDVKEVPPPTSLYIVPDKASARIGLIAANYAWR